MPSFILSDNGVSSGSAGLKSSAGNDGVLALQTSNVSGTATTALTIDTSQNITSVGNIRLNNGAADGAQLILASSGYSDWNIDNYSGNFRWYYNTTEYMRLDASGNLGIGTTSPSGTIGAGYTSRLTAYASSNAAINIKDVNGDWFLGTTSANLTFYSNTAGAERARIDSSGNLLVGMTSSSGASSSTKQVCSYYGMSINKNFTDQGGRRNWALDTEVSSAGDFVIFSSTTNTGAPNTVRLQITNAGSCYNSTGTYGTFSDIKLKENVVDTTPKLDSLMQVRVVNYNRIGEDRKEIGVIAQELEQIFPGMIDEAEDLVDGQPTGTTTKAVKYSIFVPMLIKAIQEQQAIITQLQADVAALKGTQQ